MCSTGVHHFILHGEWCKVFALCSVALTKVYVHCHSPLPLHAWCTPVAQPCMHAVSCIQWHPYVPGAFPGTVPPQSHCIYTTTNTTTSTTVYYLFH